METYKYYCMHCDFVDNNKYNLQCHIMTKKHIKLSNNEPNLEPKIFKFVFFPSHMHFATNPFQIGFLIGLAFYLLKLGKLPNLAAVALFALVIFTTVLKSKLLIFCSLTSRKFSPFRATDQASNNGIPFSISSIKIFKDSKGSRLATSLFLLDFLINSGNGSEKININRKISSKIFFITSAQILQILLQN